MTETTAALEALVELSALQGVRVHVHAFDVHEQLDEPYRVTLTIETDAEDFDALALRGSNARFLLRRTTGERAFCGLIREVEEGRGAAGNHFAEMLIEPAFAHLDLGRRTRIFQEMDPTELLEQVLGDALGAYGREVALSLDADYAKRELCVQYQESDLAFAHRLMQEEGITYLFEHDGEVERMLLVDANASYLRARGAEEPLIFRPVNAVIEDEEPIHQLDVSLHTTTTSVVVRDHDWTGNDVPVEGEAREQDEHGRDRERYEHGWGRGVTIGTYDAGLQRYQEWDAEARNEVDRRREGHASRASIAYGIGRVVGFAPGTTFELNGHPSVGVDGEYLITRVDHVDMPAELALDASQGGRESYHNRFECIPLDVVHRPVRTAAKPRIASIQTARVTGPAGEEIHVDEHGRIKVLFSWDRESAEDETSSCWVRVQQKWAGAGWGFWWIPRVGMEVVVQFLDGDPDRPLVTGAVYDANNPTPYALPDEKTKSTIKSNSTPGGGGFNELRFEDAAGQEQIYTHAQRDHDEEVERDHTTLVHGAQTIEVDGSQTQTIHGNQDERVDENQNLSVGGDRSLHAESNFDETIDGTETRSVTGDVTEDFGANETRMVAGDLTETFAVNEQRTLGADQTETIGGSVTRTVGAASSVNVVGAASQDVAAGITVTTPGAWTITAVGGLTINAPGGYVQTAPGGHRIAAPGGVTQIDSIDSLIAGVCSAKGGSIRAATGFKNEWVGTHLSMVGGTYGIGVFHLCVGLLIDQAASEDEKAGINNGNGGASAEASGATDK